MLGSFSFVAAVVFPRPVQICLIAPFDMTVMYRPPANINRSGFSTVKFASGVSYRGQAFVFFTLVVILGSAIQGALERRKNQRKAAELRRRVGW